MSTSRRVDKDVVHIYSRILLSLRKNEITPFANSNMDEPRDYDCPAKWSKSDKKEKYRMTPLIYGIEKKWHKWIYKAETHRLREWIYACLGGRIELKSVGEFWMGMYTLLYLKWITKKDLVYSTWNSVHCYVAAWMGGELAGEWTHGYVQLNPFTVHLEISQCC